MRILVTGSTGLIGSALLTRLVSAGHSTVRLVRRPPRPGSADVFWDLAAAPPASPAVLEGFDAVVHLAGESLASGRWTPERKRRIYNSRVQGTRALSQVLSSLSARPKALVCASAVGYYGDRGDELLDENSVPGQGFLATVCRDWEQASSPAVSAGIRVALLRLGVVLSREGGALPKLLPPFRMGVGGKIGTGQQYWSWIALEDAVGAFVRALEDTSLEGPVNTVAPNPVTNLVFTRTLARLLSRPSIFPLPAFAARLALGDMADEMLLSSTRVQPARLQAAGFPFRFPNLEVALRILLR